jgi:hypothetical protein
MDPAAEAAPVVARAETFEALYRAQADRVHRAFALTLGNDAIPARPSTRR